MGAAALGLSTALIADVCTLLYFNVCTPGSLVANLAVLPLASLAVWSGFLSALSGASHLAILINVFNHAAGLILLCIEKGLTFLVRIPGAFFPAHFKSASVGGGLLLAELALLFFGYTQRWEWRRGGWAPPFVLLGIAMSIGVSYGVK